MGLFKDPLQQIAAFREEAAPQGKLRELDAAFLPPWPQEPSLVLKSDTAVELGEGGSSLFFFLWTEGAEEVHPGRISLLGPTLKESSRDTLPFALIILVQGAFEDHYESCQALQDCIFGLRLQGVSLRLQPDRQKIWCRISKEALKGGFSLQHYGAALLSRLGSLPGVEGAEVIFVTEAISRENPLMAAAGKVQEIIEALLKIYEDENFDCDSCEYSELCDEVAGLREIHKGLHK